MPCIAVLVMRLTNAAKLLSSDAQRVHGTHKTLEADDSLHRDNMLMS